MPGSRTLGEEHRVGAGVLQRDRHHRDGVGDALLRIGIGLGRDDPAAGGVHRRDHRVADHLVGLALDVEHAEVVQPARPGEAHERRGRRPRRDAEQVDARRRDHRIVGEGQQLDAGVARDGVGAGGGGAEQRSDDDLGALVDRAGGGGLAARETAARLVDLQVDRGVAHVGLGEPAGVDEVAADALQRWVRRAERDEQRDPHRLVHVDRDAVVAADDARHGDRPAGGQRRDGAAAAAAPGSRRRSDIGVDSIIARPEPLVSLSFGGGRYGLGVEK